MKKPPRAFAVILNSKYEVLCMHRAKDGLWGLPGGKSEIISDARETPAQNIVREVFEETTIRLDMDALSYLKVTRGRTTIYFLCYDGVTEPHGPKTEVLAFEWKPPVELIKDSTHRNALHASLHVAVDVLIDMSTSTRDLYEAFSAT